MSAAAKVARDHSVTLCALEVLQLITDQLDQHGGADLDDILAVLQFLREIAHPGLHHTEKLLLPLLEFEMTAGERTRVDSALQRYRRTNGLLDELERCCKEGRFQEFAVTARSYTTAFGDLVFEEHLFLQT